MREIVRIALNRYLALLRFVWEIMGLVSLVAAMVVMRGEVAVPPLAPFVVGDSRRSQFRLTFRDSKAGKPIVISGKMTRTNKILDKGGSRVFSLLLEPAPGQGDKATFELGTDTRGIPVWCRQVGDDAQIDASNSLLFIMGQPLWPNTSSASIWTTAVPNPGDPTKRLTVKCSAEMERGGKAIVLKQTLDTESIEPAAGMKFQSTLRVDPASGAVKSVRERFEFSTKGEKSTVLEYEENS